MRQKIASLFSIGVTKQDIALKLNCSYNTVNRWKAGDEFVDLPRKGRPLKFSEQNRLEIVALYCQTKPFAGHGVWSFRLMESHLKENTQLINCIFSKSTIQRVLKGHSLRPHLNKYFLHISDPNFFSKMKHIINLYLNPPPNLFSFDESPNIQILQRLVPDIQTENQHFTLNEFEYKRNGTFDLFTCLEVETGKVFNECRTKHDTENLIAFMKNHIQSISKTEDINYIMDNLNTHYSYDMCQFVARHSKISCPKKEELYSPLKRKEWLSNPDKRITFHFTPLHGSWLNMVEIWFGLIGSKCLKDSYISMEEMFGSITSYTEVWNSSLAHPFNWQYTGKGLEEKAIRRIMLVMESKLFLNIELRTLTNQFGLIKNLYEQNYKIINSKLWDKLIILFFDKIEDIKKIINLDTGPVRRKRATCALGLLTVTLEIQHKKLMENIA